MNTESVKNRGYYKIEGAARAFNFDFKDKVVLDIGSSTGGFTQYAIDHGAKKVIAIEKGTNQMKEPLRSDLRVELHEKTDVFGVGITSIHTPDVILADVSFISLTKILKYAKDNLAGKETDFLVMLKPQFEADDRDLKDGVIKNDSLRRQVIKKFEQWLKSNGFLIVKKKDNDLKGKHGNIERFYYLHLAK